jgi:hypothetical protein
MAMLQPGASRGYHRQFSGRQPGRGRSLPVPEDWASVHPASDKAAAGHVHCGGHAKERCGRGCREDQQSRFGQRLQGPVYVVCKGCPQYQQQLLLSSQT